MITSREYPDPQTLLEITAALGQLRVVIPSWWEDLNERNRISKEHDVKIWRHIELYPIQELVRESNRKIRVYGIDISSSGLKYAIRGPNPLMDLYKSTEDLRLEAILIALSMRIETAFKPIYH